MRRIARDDGGANSVSRQFPDQMRGRRRPCATRMHVRLEFADQGHNVGFVEHQSVIDGTESGDQERAGAFREDRAAWAFQFSGCGVGMNGYDQKIALRAGGLEITDVAGVENIEDAVGEDDFAAGAAVFFEYFVQTGAGKNFFACVHAALRAARKSIIRRRWRQTVVVRLDGDSGASPNTGHGAGAWKTEQGFTAEAQRAPRKPGLLGFRFGELRVQGAPKLGFVRYLQDDAAVVEVERR